MNASVRLVLDTNTIVSGLLWKGTPHALLEIVGERRDRVLCSSPKLLAELADVLSRQKFRPILASAGKTSEQLLSRYISVAQIVRPESVPAVIHSDPDDDHVLACAVAAQADLIVSGDGHLLKLKAYRGISIATATQALRQISAAG